MAAKAAIKDVGRAMDVPYGEVDRLAKLIPNVLGITLDQALNDREPESAPAQRQHLAPRAAQHLQEPARFGHRPRAQHIRHRHRCQAIFDPVASRL